MNLLSQCQNVQENSVDSPYDTLNQTSHNHIQSLLLKFWNGIRWLCLVVFAGLRNRAFILRRFILFYFFDYQCLKSVIYITVSCNFHSLKTLKTTFQNFSKNVKILDFTVLLLSFYCIIIVLQFANKKIQYFVSNRNWWCNTSPVTTV